MPISDNTFRPGVSVILSQNPVEQHTGADCTGVNGAANRTLTVTKTLVSGSFALFINGMFMRANLNYTVSGQVITIIDALNNTDTIDVN